MRAAKRLKHRLEYIGARSVIGLCSLAPLSLLRRAGEAIGWAAFHVVRIRRDIAVENIRSSLTNMDPRRAEKIALGSYMNLGRSMFEASSLLRLSGDKVLRMVTVDGLKNLEAAVAHDKGAIIFTGHFGNWELLAPALVACGYPAFGVDTEHSNPRTHQLIVELRRSQGITVLPATQSLRDFMHVLTGKNVVGFPADQDGGRDGVFVEFFGRPTSTQRALGLIAARSGCPVVPGFVIRENRDHHRLALGEPVWADRTLRSEAAVTDLTQRLTTELERVIRRHPDQYFWVHRRWKTRPATGA